MTNLIINKDGTLYTLPDSVSCGTVNGVDIKEIEVNNNGSLVTVWKLQDKITVTLGAVNTKSSTTEWRFYYLLEYNNNVYRINKKSVFRCGSDVGKLFVLYNGNSNKVFTLQTVDDCVTVSGTGSSSFASNVNYNPFYNSASFPTNINKFFDIEVKNSAHKNNLSFLTSNSRIENVINYYKNPTYPEHVWKINNIEITPEQFYQATGVNP